MSRGVYYGNYLSKYSDYNKLKSDLVAKFPKTFSAKVTANDLDSTSENDKTLIKTKIHRLYNIRTHEINL